MDASKRTTCLGMLVSYCRVKFLRPRAILQEERNTLIQSYGRPFKVVCVCVRALTHAEHSTGRTSCRWPATVSVLPDT